MQKLYIILLVGLFLAISCKKKSNPGPDPVIVGRDGDTCLISKVSYEPYRNIVYEYSGNRVSKITLQIDGHEYPAEPEYNSEGRLVKVKGFQLDTNYEYDTKGRLIRENRTLHNENIFTLIPHWEAKIFDYNTQDQVIKCSYVEGRGSDYNPFYVKKGEVYRYEVYWYNFQGCVEKMESYERTPRSATFDRTAEYIYQYDKMINPFYGHPGIYDIKTYFGCDTGNAPLTFSKNNIIKTMTNQKSEITGYVYSSTKYPLSAQNLRWQENIFRSLTLEYKNCR